MNIAYDFPLILIFVVAISGVIALLDILFWAKKRKKEQRKMPVIIEYSRSFFPILLLVLVVRSFLVQPYRVPSGSLEPTISVGDFIVVNQFAYGLRLPVINTKILNISEPKVGEIALFRWPKNPHIVFVKRVVGTPGDHIVYKDKTLYINGEKAPQEFLRFTWDTGEKVLDPVKELSETLPSGVKHNIYIRPNEVSYGDFDIQVPEGKYFMMGDNRDGSDDSRDWGFVPEENLVGKAMVIWLSWDSDNHSIRWKRMGTIVR